jgi:putative serine protease PepD
VSPRSSLWAATRPTEDDVLPSATRERQLEEARRAADARARAEERARAKAERRRRRRVALAAAGALALAVTGLLIGLGLGERDGALPAAGGGAPAERAGRTAVGRVYATAERAVVSVQVRQGSRTASGTGFVIDTDGTIVTNSHVVGDADTAQVRFGDRGNAIEARVLGSDQSTDLAAIRVDPADVDRIRALRLGDSDDVKVGDTAVAIGHPFGLDRTATAGIVSGVGREIRAPNGFQIDEVIQTDAPINPGNSGGPLLDSRGRVIGVSSQIATAGNRGNVGIGFAVPSNTVREVVPRLTRGQSVVRPYLGLTTGPSVLGPGAVVIEAEPGGPADDAGLIPGDRVVSVDGQPVSEPADVAQAIEGRKPGDRVEVEVERSGAQRSFEVELGTRPERGGP